VGNTGAPYTEETSANPLRNDLQEERVKHQAETANRNPLKDDLNEERIEVEVTKTPQPEPTTQQNSSQSKPSGSNGPEARPEAEPKKEIDWSKQSRRIVEMWDKGASRFLKWLAKDENRKRWELTDDDIADIMYWLPDVAQQHKLSVDNPIWGLLYTVGIIYGEKGYEAYSLRQEREANPVYQRNYSQANPTRQPSGEMSQDEMERIWEMVQKRKRDVYNVPEPEVVYEVVDGQTIRRETKSRNEESDTPSYDFDLRSQINRNKQRQNGNEQPITRQNSTGDGNLNGNQNQNSTSDEILFQPTARPGIAKDENGREEAYTELKEDKRGRPTEITRCRFTRKLFERFVGSDKVFINHEAKNRYNYLKRLEREKKVPKDGWPPGWQFDP